MDDNTKISALAPPYSLHDKTRRETSLADQISTLDTPDMSSQTSHGGGPSSTPPPLDKDYITRPDPEPGSRRSSAVDIALIDQVFADDRIDTNTYGVSELRDGFFDAMFLKPAPLPPAELEEDTKATLPAAFDKHSPLSPKHFVPTQWRLVKSLLRRVTATRSGIRLFKSFLAFFVAYVLCLIPSVRDWLGRYNYIMPVSVIINHPARAFGSQLDGAILTSLGTAAGLGWAVIGLLLSTSTLAASAGYGGILALFLAIFMAVIAWMRSFFVRSYQAVLCAGIAITFTTLAETSSAHVEWSKLLSYAIPWFLGQGIALVVNLFIFPDAGARRLATTLHESFDDMQDALIIPRPRDTRLRRRLARAFVELSQAYRDLRLDLTVTRFRPDDFGELRNLMQASIRALLSMETETYLFDEEEIEEADEQIAITVDGPTESPLKPAQGRNQEGENIPDPDEICRKVVKELSTPTRDLLSCMSEGLRRCDAALMDLSGYRQHLGPPKDVSPDVVPLQIRMRKSKAAFDAVESRLLDSGDLPSSSIQDSDIVQLFVFARHVREAAATIDDLMAKVYAMQHISDWPKMYLPSYPFWKALHRTNPQIRHDIGGITAGSYHVTFAEIARLLNKIKSREHKPSRGASEESEFITPQQSHATMDAEVDGDTTSKKSELGYKTWRVLRHLQGFEGRYAFKVCLATSLLSVPSYLLGSKDWWDRYEAWWAVSLAWIMMHPRVGGNFQDLVTRAFAAISGAVWSGAAHAAGGGNPYVLAVFAAIYMIPMLYRFTQSSHPRSGLVGCLSFTVISLGLKTNSNDSSIVLLAVYKGLAFLVGTTVPVLVNWVLWPFVARHELRYALSSMLFFMSVIYRNIVGKYVYFEQGHAPTPEDIERSEMLEGRLREGFVRIRQLLVLTRHEIRLRAPFDPVPYSALADSCERFFEHLIAVRQSALFYNPQHIRNSSAAADKLLPLRRDAVAAILGNLYILAGALRSQRKVPRYLPSAVAARKRLLERTAQASEEMAQDADRDACGQKWTDLYSFSFNESLTGCVAKLEELEQYTKIIVGEQGFDNDFKDDEDSND